MDVYILVHDRILYILYKAKTIFTDETMRLMFILVFVLRV